MQKPKGKTMHHLISSISIFIALRFLPVFLLPVSCLLFFTAGDLYANESAVWNALKSGNHFALLRHAIAPGTGDPGHFALGECSTQRNLSHEGRNQAKKIGDRFRANGIDKVRVFSSQWCRCLETAKLLSLGPVQELPVLNSFFRHYERKKSQTQALKEWLVQQDFTQPLLLVTHQVNITALTDIYPDSGEIIVVRQAKPGEFIVVGSVQTE